MNIRHWAGLLLISSFFGGSVQAQEFLLVVDARPAVVKGNGTRIVSEAPATLAGFRWNQIGGSDSVKCGSLEARLTKLAPSKWKLWADRKEQPRVDRLWEALACSQPGDANPKDRQAFLAESQRVRGAAAAVLAIAQANPDESTLRVIAAKGGDIKIAVVHSGFMVVKDGDATVDTSVESASCPVGILARPIDVPISAKPRESTITADIGRLLQIGLAIARSGTVTIDKVGPVDCASLKDLTTIPVDLVSIFNYRIPLNRANIEVTVDASAAPTLPFVAVGGVIDSAAIAKAKADHAAANEGTPAPIKAPLVTGPREHWFLSGDVPLKGTTAKHFKFNGENQQVELSEKPSSYHLSANFLLGDLLGERRPFLGNFYLKGSIAASTKPLDSYGVGLGYYGTLLPKKLGFSLEAFSPYVAYVWTKSDSVVAAATEGGSEGVAGNVKTVGEWRWGVGVNLGKVLGWVKDN